MARVLLVALGLFAVSTEGAQEALQGGSCTAHKPWAWYNEEDDSKCNPWNVGFDKCTTWKSPGNRWHLDYLHHMDLAINGTGSRFDPLAQEGKCPFGRPSDCPWIIICGTIRNNSTSAEDFANFVTGGIYVMIILHAVWIGAVQLNPRSLALFGSFMFNNFIYTVVLHANINSPRPVESCMSGCGMPSGHVGNAYILFAWDCYWFFILSRKPCASKPAGGFLGDNGEWPFELLRLLVFAACAVMLTPMAWARWVLRDHDVAQCLAGAFMGLLNFVVWNAVFWRVVIRPPARTWNVWEVVQVLFLCRTVQGVTGPVAFLKDVTGWSYDGPWAGAGAGEVYQAAKLECGGGSGKGGKPIALQSQESAMEGVGDLKV